MSEKTNKLSVLLIGCGNIAGGFDVDSVMGVAPRTHAGAYVSHGSFSIDSCIEPDEAKRAAFMRRWGVKSGYADITEVANSHKGRFDVISICSPTASHYVDTVAAMALQPRLLFCEKPLCADVVQAADLVQSCATQKILLAVNHNRRWDPEVARLRYELRSGQWGALRSVCCHYNKGVLNNGSHMIDLLQDLFGPLELCHAGLPLIDYTPDDPTVPALLRTGSGIQISLNAGHAADYSLFELQVVTEHGLITMEDGGMRWRRRIATASHQFANYRALPEGELEVGGYLQTMPNAVANIFDALRAGVALASTGHSALESQKLCDRLRTASFESVLLSPPGTPGSF